MLFTFSNLNKSSTRTTIRLKQICEEFFVLTLVRSQSQGSLLLDDTFSQQKIVLVVGEIHLHFFGGLNFFMHKFAGRHCISCFVTLSVASLLKRNFLKIILSLRL